MFKKIISILTATALLAAFNFSVTVCADTAEPLTGSCGDNVTYTLTDTDGDGNYDTLEISGTGAMEDYSGAQINSRPYLIQEGSKYSYYTNTHIKTVIVAEGITSVGDYAFYFFNGVESVTLPSSLTSIGAESFYELTKLTKITLPDGLKTISRHAFYGCGLETVTIQNGVTTINTSTFARCTSLTSIVIPDSVTTIGVTI